MRTIGTTVRNTVGALALLTLIPASGWAVGGPWGPCGGAGFQGPPKEAFDACSGKKAGDAVRFTTPRGDNVASVCREFDGKLAAAPAMGPGQGRRGAGHHGGGKGMGMEELNLTAEQKTKIQGILDEERKKTEPLRKEVWETRGQLWETAHKTPYDEAAVRKLAADQEKKRTELIVSRANAMNRVTAVLTPEQREMAEKKGYCGKGHGPGKGRGPGRGFGPGDPDCPWR